jgi:hypothetical protein
MKMDDTEQVSVQALTIVGATKPTVWRPPLLIPRVHPWRSAQCQQGFFVLFLLVNEIGWYMLISLLNFIWNP